MRFAVLASLCLLSIAGCLEDAEAPAAAAEEAQYLPAGLQFGHPGYDFWTEESIPVAPQPGVLFRDDADGVRTWFKPAPWSNEEERAPALEHLVQVDDVRVGHGIHTVASFAIAGGTGGDMQVVDISVPAAPKVIGGNEDTPVRDANHILFPDGRLIIISSSGGGQMVGTDMTDPTAPVVVASLDTDGSNHNIAVVPGSPIAYNSGQDIVDWSDPENPVLVGNFNEGGGCHDIAFSMDREADRFWALCAGYAETEIWDIHDATAPELVVKIPYTATQGTPVVGQSIPTSVGGQQIPSAPGTLSHLALVNHDATVLIMGDETGGGAIDGCDFYMEGPEGEVISGPLGNLWFYDITDPENPVLRGHVSPSFTDADMPVRDSIGPPGSCTAHFGEVLGKSSQLVMSFYSAGLLLVDFSDLDNPRIADRWDEGGDLWDVQSHQGYLVTGDMNRGMDILTLG